MRGIVFDGHELVFTEDLTVRAPEHGEVLVRILASGICHSDLNVVDGVSPRPTPIVLGHEGAGEVVRCGAGVGHMSAGDRVVIASITPCRACRACAAGRLSDCADAFGSGERPFRFRGEPTLRYANTSSWAEHVVVKATQLFTIGDLPMAGASLLATFLRLTTDSGWAQRDLNPRLQPCEGRTLPLSYAPRCGERITPPRSGFQARSAITSSAEGPRRRVLPAPCSYWHPRRSLRATSRRPRRGSPRKRPSGCRPVRA